VLVASSFPALTPKERDMALNPPEFPPNSPADPPLNSPLAAPDRRNVWLRGLMMILMATAFQLAATLLGLLAVVQFVMALVNSAPNHRLSEFGQALGRYLRQIADFVSFGSDDAPFPFADWPSGR
jgi:hypothetical protein